MLVLEPVSTRKSSPDTQSLPVKKAQQVQESGKRHNDSIQLTAYSYLFLFGPRELFSGSVATVGLFDWAPTLATKT
jgi:hypothetical protein